MVRYADAARGRRGRLCGSAGACAGHGSSTSPADMTDMLRAMFPCARHVELEERRVVRPLGTIMRLTPHDRDKTGDALSDAGATTIWVCRP